MKTFNDTLSVNNNVKLRKGGRKAVVMDMSELKALVESYVKKYEEDAEIDDDVCMSEKVNQLLSWLMYTKLDKDRKVKFDAENMYIYYGITSIGVPYIRVKSGGDWQMPMISYVYYDGKDLRLYVPTKGNPFNRNTMEPFCEDGIEDGQFICKELGIKLGEDVEVDGEVINSDDYADVEDFYEDLSAMFCNADLLGIDDNGCLEDFESRLTIIEK